jgi:hypothetical protein
VGLFTKLRWTESFDLKKQLQETAGVSRFFDSENDQNQLPKWLDTHYYI